MSAKNVFVFCGDDCKSESMTKEQILTAISQAISTGEITDVDTGFITKIKELNANGALSFWVGTQAEYNALTEKADNCFYIVTDETVVDDIDAVIKELRDEVESVTNSVTNIINNMPTGGNVLYTGNISTDGYYVNCVIPDILKYTVIEAEFDTSKEVYSTNYNRIILTRKANEKVFRGNSSFIIKNASGGYEGAPVAGYLSVDEAKGRVQSELITAVSGSKEFLTAITKIIGIA